MDTQPLLLAIKPHFAELILQGRKAYEYRRTVRRVRPGTIVLLYATSPLSAIVGHFTAGEVLIDSPDDLWDMTAHGGGIRKGDFDAYFAGVTEGCAVEVKGAIKWTSPLGLQQLRRLLPGFVPPRCVQSVESDSPLVSRAVAEANNGHGNHRKARS